MLLSPDQYAQASVLELLREAARGRIPLDQRWVRAIVERGESCVEDLLTFLREDDDYLFDLEEDVVLIARHLASPAMLPVLLELAERYGDQEWPDELADAFRVVGAPALEPLLELRKKLENPFGLNDLLATLGVRDPRILQALVEELEVDPLLGSLALSLYGDPAARPYLEKALDRAASEPERREIREIIERLDQPREPETPEPFDIWSWYPEEADPDFEHLPVEDLIALLESPVARWRLGAADELGRRGEPASPAKDKLYELATKDEAPEVRGACWRALAQIQSEGPWREEMLKRLGDPAVPLAERRLILLGLAQRDEDDPLVRRWVLDFYDNRETRAMAMEAMRLTGNPGFARFMIENLEDPDLEIRRQAVLGVGTFGLRAQLHRLEKLFSSPLRREALASYAALVPMEPSRLEARRTLRKIEEAAGGLSEEEGWIVTDVLNDRLVTAGHPPVFVDSEEEEEYLEELGEGGSRPQIRAEKVGRNDPCPCGSGKKYKKCCGA
jgi:hypothetical protein